MTIPDRCPTCGADLTGEPIPEEYLKQGLYGEGVTHYSRRIGVEVQGTYDGTLYWLCPDCNCPWPRDFGPGRLSELSVEYVRRWAQERAIRAVTDDGDD